jgi:LacI family transcriptional regulator
VGKTIYFFFISWYYGGTQFISTKGKKMERKSDNPTMEDVAQRANVSVTTVSHVINKTRHVQMETRQAVLRAIEELDYRLVKLNKPAKAICIGIIIADSREEYYIGIMKTIESTAADYGVLTIFCDSESNPEKEEKNLTLLSQNRVNGILFVPVFTDRLPPILENITIPVILIDKQYESHHFLFIGIDNFRSCYQGTKYLMEKGAKRIGFIGHTNSIYTSSQRFFGYKTALMESESAAISRDIALDYYAEENTFSLIRQFMTEENLDGLVCVNSSLCYEVIEALDTLDEKIKSQLKILCFDDNRWLDYLKYPVSAISQPVAEIGIAAVENMLQCIENNTIYAVKRELLFETTLIDRIG